MRQLAARALVLTALVSAAFILGATPVQAQTSGPCVVFVNEQDARNHAESSDAVEVDSDNRVQVAIAVDPSRQIGHAVVDLEFEPFNWTVLDEDFAGSTWVGSFDLGGSAAYGVGLYRAIASAELTNGEECTGAAWFRITGRSPFATVAGAGGTFLVVLGLGLQVAGIIRASRGRGGVVMAIAGGIPTGAGALILAQQFGAQAIGADSVALWLAAPSAAGGLARWVAGRSSEPADAAPVPAEAGAAPAPAAPVSAPSGADELQVSEEPMAAPSPPAPTETHEAAQPGPAVGVQTDDISPQRAEPPPVAASQAPPPHAPPPPAPSHDVEPPAELAATDTAAIEPTEEALPVAGVEVGGDVHGGTIVESNGPAPSEDLPRTAYARLDCPDVVVASEEFELTVGIARAPSPDVVGEPLVRPPSSEGPYTLSVHVVADGFTLRDGESWRVQLPVTHDAPYPAVPLHLTAALDDAPVKPRSIRALYSVDGQTMGMAYRSIAVARSGDLVADAEARPQEAGVDLSVPTARAAPDLTVRILEGESEGRLLWTFESPHDAIDLPDEPVESNLGEADDPKSFARQLVDRVNAREGKPGLYQYLVGVGRTLTDEMPQPFWDVLRAVAAGIDSTPTVLILSEEPYIPWELSVVEPPLDPEAPPFLSAQTEIGRWVLGHRRPKLPPPESADVASIAVISGVYDRPGWARLVAAEEEAAELAQQYGAQPVNASAQEVLDCLAGSPPADLMHFAVHGVYDPAGIQDGVVLVDGHALDPMEVKGSSFTATPFVFLNACQVGSGNKILGDHAGLAAAFLWSGACGVVAPLWSIKDTVAKGVAVRFYEQAFNGSPIGTILRNERAAFKAGEDALSATYLAYQFFGHPGMKITRSGGNGRE
jgi:CHAT domain